MSHGLPVVRGATGKGPEVGIDLVESVAGQREFAASRIDEGIHVPGQVRLCGGGEPAIEVGAGPRVVGPVDRRCGRRREPGLPADFRDRRESCGVVGAGIECAAPDAVPQCQPG